MKLEACFRTQKFTLSGSFFETILRRNKYSKRVAVVCFFFKTTTKYALITIASSNFSWKLQTGCSEDAACFIYFSSNAW